MGEWKKLGTFDTAEEEKFNKIETRRACTQNNAFANDFLEKKRNKQKMKERSAEKRK